MKSESPVTSTKRSNGAPPETIEVASIARRMSAAFFRAPPGKRNTCTGSMPCSMTIFGQERR
jgi:hypothetical protein